LTYSSIPKHKACLSFRRLFGAALSKIESRWVCSEYPVGLSFAKQLASFIPCHPVCLEKRRHNVVEPGSLLLPSPSVTTRLSGGRSTHPTGPGQSTSSSSQLHTMCYQPSHFTGMLRGVSFSSSPPSCRLVEAHVTACRELSVHGSAYRHPQRGQTVDTAG